MSKTYTTTAEAITQKINTPDLAAAYKRIVVTENEANKETFDITVEFLRKHGMTPKAKKAYDSGKHTFVIGNKEEFLHRRLQIQDAVRRCQINNRYTRGGRGRKKKCQAIERWHEKEKHYVETKLHTYSKLLVQEAVRHRCGTIVLLNQREREDAAQAEYHNGKPFLIRNWSYYGMKEKISYKAAMHGIRLIEDEAIIE